MIWPKDSLVPGLSQHQGLFWPDHCNTKESFGQIAPQNFKGHFPKIKNTKELFVHTTAELCNFVHQSFPLFFVFRFTIGARVFPLVGKYLFYVFVLYFLFTVYTSHSAGYLRCPGKRCLGFRVHHNELCDHIHHKHFKVTCKKCGDHLDARLIRQHTKNCGIKTRTGELVRHPQRPAHVEPPTRSGLTNTKSASVFGQGCIAANSLVEVDN